MALKGAVIKEKHGLACLNTDKPRAVRHSCQDNGVVRTFVITDVIYQKKKGE